MKPFNKKAFIINLLRRGTYRWPSRNAVLKRARVERGIYKCELCLKLVDRHDISLDHKSPVVDPTVGFVDWQVYIDRMYCEESGYQAICGSCHDAKTSGENQIRRRTKAECNAQKRADYKTKKTRAPKTNKHTGSSLDRFLEECGIELPSEPVSSQTKKKRK